MPLDDRGMSGSKPIYSPNPRDEDGWQPDPEREAPSSPPGREEPQRLEENFTPGPVVPTDAFDDDLLPDDDNRDVDSNQ
jgi:hypothetical protein